MEENRTEVLNSLIAKREKEIEERVLDRQYADSWEQSAQISEDIDNIQEEIDALKQELKFDSTILPFVKDFIKDICDKDGYYVEEPLAYDDRISANTIVDAFARYKKELKTFSSPEEFSSFEDFLNTELCENVAYDREDELAAALTNSLKNKGLLDDFNEYVYTVMGYSCLSEFLYDETDYAGLRVDLDEFIDKTNISLMFGTASERNHDMNCLNLMFGEDTRNREDMLNNAFTYLMYQQGYTFKDLANAISTGNGNKFFKSVREESLGLSDYQGELTVLVNAKGRNLVNLLDVIARAETDKTFDAFVKVPKDAMVGFFNEWSGAGAMFDIVPNKDMYFPVSMVRNIQLDNLKNMKYEYTVKDVYAMSESAWNSEISLADDETNKEMLESDAYSMIKDSTPADLKVYADMLDRAIKEEIEL